MDFELSESGDFGGGFGDGLIFGGGASSAREPAVAPMSRAQGPGAGALPPSPGFEGAVPGGGGGGGVGGRGGAGGGGFGSFLGQRARAGVGAGEERGDGMGAGAGFEAGRCTLTRSLFLLYLSLKPPAGIPI